MNNSRVACRHCYKERLRTISHFANYSRHDKIVSALTEYDRNEQLKADRALAKGKLGRWHNSHFLGIALSALDDMEQVNGNPRDYFNAGALDAILLALGEIV